MNGIEAALPAWLSLSASFAGEPVELHPLADPIRRRAWQVRR